MKKQFYSRYVALVWLLLSCISCSMESTNDNVIDLAGEWHYKVDPDGVGKKQKFYEQTFDKVAMLPASSDEIGIGVAEEITDTLNGLQRRHYYVGNVWYQKYITIPPTWDGKEISLFLERCHWMSDVWVDNYYVGKGESLSAPHTFNMKDVLTPGEHTITVCIDNRLPFYMGSFASSISNHTQTNWNGMIGRLELRKSDAVHIKHVRAFPNIADNKVRIETTIVNTTGGAQTGTGVVNIVLDGEKKGIKQNIEVQCDGASTVINTYVDMDEDVELWSEFNPKFYQAEVSIAVGENSSTETISFGMRELGIKDTMFTVNGKKVYLRGNLECCIFPLTGHPPMDVAEWERIYRIMKDCGLNHVRFHSWCPPNAAFEAADRVGFYLQVEGPRANVGEESEERNAFMVREMNLINASYGNHPSYFMATTGNELHESSNLNETIITNCRADDNRHLYSKTSGGFGMDHISDESTVDDYKVAGIRGIFGATTHRDHSGAIEKIPFPLMSHEIGQWCVYPNVEDTVKYKGVLNPINLVAIGESLKKNGLYSQLADFIYVTGMHSALLYKEEVEVLMRTKNHAGFQLLQLQDYPGQGTANVGLYDLFWDTKGFITPEQFSRFASATVPLLRMEKRTYKNNETFEATLDISHYGENALKGVTPTWVMKNEAGTVVAQGELPAMDIPQGVRMELGAISSSLSSVTEATKLNIEVSIEGTSAANDWDIWCYPATLPEEPKINFTTDFEKALALLGEGEKVLFCPQTEGLKAACKGSFFPSFWSPIWYWSQPRGGDVPMGLLCDVEHPALADFPTDRYTNWQWWEPLEHSNVMIVDALPHTIKPIVQVVDNYGRNRRLADIFEANVSKGKLLVCSIDLSESRADKDVVVKQLKYSLYTYVASTSFNPISTIEVEELRTVFK